MFRRFKNLSSPILVLSFTVLSPALALTQQVKPRLVQQIVYNNQPVEIIAVKVRGVAVKPKQKFDGDNDWLNGMTVTVKNVFDKPVAYVSLLVGAYYERDGKRKQRDSKDVQAVVELMYGAQPAGPGDSAPPYRAPLQPGETLDLVLSERKRDELYSLLAEDNASTDVMELTVRVYLVFFEGDSETKWKTWRMLRRDPNDSRQWVPVKANASLTHTTKNRGL
jgi:hypothetical protein